jgi:hypothetical protein
MKHFSEFHKALSFAKAQRGILKRVDDGWLVTLSGPIQAEVPSTVAVPKKVRQMPRFTMQKAYLEAQRMADGFAQTQAEEHLTNASGSPYTLRKKSGFGTAFATPNALGKAWAVSAKPINHRSVKFTSEAERLIPEPEAQLPASVFRSQLAELKQLRANAPEGRSMPCEHLDSQILETKRELLRLLASDLATAAIDGDDQAADGLLRNLVGLQEEDARRILREEVKRQEESPEATALPAEEYKKQCKKGRIRCFSHKHAASEAIGRISGRDVRTGELHRSRGWRTYTPPTVCSVVKHRTRGDWWCLENQVIRWDSKHFEANEIYRTSSCQIGYTIEQLSTPVSVPMWSVEVLMNGMSVQTTRRALKGSTAGDKVAKAITNANPNASFEIGEIKEADADTMSDITIDELEAGLMDWAEHEADELQESELAS